MGAAVIWITASGGREVIHLGQRSYRHASQAGKFSQSSKNWHSRHQHEPWNRFESPRFQLA